MQYVDFIDLNPFLEEIILKVFMLNEWPAWSFYKLPIKFEVKFFLRFAVEVFCNI